MKVLVFLIGCIASFTMALEVPHYIKTCSRSDPNFSKCAVDSGNSAYSFILKGDKNLKVPPLDPYKVQSLTIKASPSLIIKLTDLVVTGLKTVKITTFLFDGRKAIVEAKADFFQVISNYEMNGKILILPILGKGPSNITLELPSVRYEVDNDIINKRGLEYLKVKSHNLKYALKHMYFNFENLFNGDKKLGPEMNTFINQNWEEVEKEVNADISNLMDAIVTSVVQQYLNKIPLNKLFDN